MVPGLLTAKGSLVPFLVGRSKTRDLRQGSKWDSEHGKVGFLACSWRSCCAEGQTSGSWNPKSLWRLCRDWGPALYYCVWKGFSWNMFPKFCFRSVEMDSPLVLTRQQRVSPKDGMWKLCGPFWLACSLRLPLRETFWVSGFQSWEWIILNAKAGERTWESSTS